MSEKTKGQILAEELSYKKESYFETADAATVEKMFEYAQGYMRFLDEAKTEREAVAFGVRAAKEKGYTPYRFGEKLTAGDVRYYDNRGKNLFLIRKGNKPLDQNGVRILVSHIDSPRIDLKQNPLYEDSGMAFFKTHYYGGIRKYQWTTLPLALHGVAVKANGEPVSFTVGEKEEDPVFYITDLLPHLAQDQNQKPLGSAIPGEALNILVGALPYRDEAVTDKIKLNVLSILNERYGLTEEDFLSAEICAVPALHARDVGFDRALIGAYGHDDRVCAYPMLTAILEEEKNDQTVIVVLADKEEVGSDGNTGMQCSLLLDLIEDMAACDGVSGAAVRAVSKCISADVTAAYDPNYAEVYEKRNSAILSAGAAMSKYTGVRGKASSNDASAEFVGFIRRIFAKGDVVWQSSEIGKVDAGGGGMVSKYVANMNIDTVDVGLGVLSVHAPYELVSKADLYALYRACVAFCRYE